MIWCNKTCTVGKSILVVKSLPEFKLKFNAVLVKIQGEYSLGSDKQILKYNDQELKENI